MKKTLTTFVHELSFRFQHLMENVGTIAREESFFPGTIDENYPEDSEWYEEKYLD
ncbi:hypothetical protein HYV57_03820 [Candidatus Peregrinibacteria bacterium]|nr:hypothetical protein [Candidatus Peregrinibacteria bacterium]